MVTDGACLPPALRNPTWLTRKPPGHYHPARICRSCRMLTLSVCAISRASAEVTGAPPRLGSDRTRLELGVKEPVVVLAVSLPLSPL